MAAHFNGWPNNMGFELTHEEKKPVSLKISGVIPSYAAGTLYRTGPGGCQTACQNGIQFYISHWFDGFSQVHRFELIRGEVDGCASITTVLYNSRFTCDEVINSISRTGSLDRVTFAQKRDPCESFFKKFVSTFVTFAGQYIHQSTPLPSDRNAGVTMSKNIPGLPRPSIADGTQDLFNKTDACFYQKLDPETLEPVGIAYQTDLHPELVGALSASHAKSDPITGDVYNYNLELGSHPRYRVFHVSTRTGKTQVLATIQGPTVKAAYIHSLFLTETYVVLCIWPSYFVLGGAKILWEKNLLDSMANWNPQAKSQWFVISRRGGLVAAYEGDPFFCFHTINAWDEGEDIICELAAYENMDVLKRYYYENLMSTGPGASQYAGEKGKTTRAHLERWRLTNISSQSTHKLEDCIPIVRAVKEWSLGSKVSLELPTISPLYISKPSRFIYGFTDHGESTLADGIGKYDTLHNEALRWSKHGHSPGEPIFVRDPDGVHEDDGVLLSVVLDGNSGMSYLLVLNAKNLEVVGKAQCNWAIGMGFHGLHVSKDELRRAVDI